MFRRIEMKQQTKPASFQQQQQQQPWYSTVLAGLQQQRQQQRQLKAQCEKLVKRKQTAAVGC